MLRQRGSTNGFRFTETLIGAAKKPFVVVPRADGQTFFAVHPSWAKRVARDCRAPGFWRLKK